MTATRVSGKKHKHDRKTTKIEEESEAKTWKNIRKSLPSKINL